MLIAIIFGQMDDARLHMAECVSARGHTHADLGRGRSNSDLQTCKQGASGRRGGLASMHTSTGRWQRHVVVGGGCGAPVSRPPLFTPAEPSFIYPKGPFFPLSTSTSWLRSEYSERPPQCQGCFVLEHGVCLDKSTRLGACALLSIKNPRPSECEETLQKDELSKLLEHAQFVNKAPIWRTGRLLNGIFLWGKSFHRHILWFIRAILRRARMSALERLARNLSRCSRRSN